MKEIHIELTDAEQKQIAEYKTSHYCEEFKTNSGGFGSTSKLSFVITYTSIGPCIEILCPYCKYKEDITDVSSW